MARITDGKEPFRGVRSDESSTPAISTSAKPMMYQREPALLDMREKGWTPTTSTERPIVGYGTDTELQPDISPEPLKPGVDSVRVREFNQVLNKYKAGKASVDNRVRQAEEWWKMRNQTQMEKVMGEGNSFTSVTGWLHNVIVSKHADAMDAYPAANVLPREEGDKLDAWILQKIIPVILEQNNFERTYSDCMWQKLKFGTGVYMISWDRTKLGGLGDISIKKVSLLNVFWEPGVDDIQDSRFFFHVISEDKDLLREKYPEALAHDPIMQDTITTNKMPHDDTVDRSNKVNVVDVYYKRYGKLQYCKYVGETVLYASEDDVNMQQNGFYHHGKYPFVFDALFPVEESPNGYGFVDTCANAQVRIDMMSTAALKNTLAGAAPRYFQRIDGGINEEEFMDLNKTIVHVAGNLGEDSLRLVDYKPLNGNYINFLNATVDELRETSTNTETSTGSSTNGVTAASALAALQEASGKSSRDANKSAYRCFADAVEMVIELIRQFYDMPRQFRITGSMGVERFIAYSNAHIKPQPQGMLGGVDLGSRMPVFDIRVVPEKESSYTKMARNELALQFYGNGFFNPQLVDQSLMCLEMMEFDGKDELMQKLTQQGTMFDELQKYKTMCTMLASKFMPQLVPGLMAGAPAQPFPRGSKEKPDLDKGAGEASHVRKARERAATASQPGGSTA